MTQNQDNITTMFEATLAFLDKNSSVWNGTAAFADAVTRATEGTAQVRTKTGKQQSPTTGVTDEKAQTRDDLEEKLLLVADAIAAFAAKSGDPDLAAKVDVTKSSLDRLPDSDLVQTAQRVLAAAAANLAALGPYGIKDAQKEALEEAASLFSGKKESPRQAMVGRKVETLSLPEAIRSVRSIFRNELDKLMTQFKKPNPDFYNGYFTARIIVNRAATQPANAPGPSPAPSPAPPK